VNPGKVQLLRYAAPSFAATQRCCASFESHGKPRIWSFFRIQLALKKGTPMMGPLFKCTIFI